MEAGQETQEGVHYEEEPFQETPAEENAAAQEVAEEPQNENHVQEQERQRMDNHSVDRSGFIHGLSVGLGLGCIATFVIVWITIFFTPQMPPVVTYENLLAIFIYPLIYLLAVGLIALTAGIVREYYATRSRY